MKKLYLVLTFVLLSFVLMACDNATLNIEEVKDLDAINVAQFTTFDELGLPETVEVTLSDGSETNVSVAWDRSRGRYVSDQVGAVTLTGDLITAGDVTNRQTLTASLEVTVVAEDMMETLSASGRFTTFLSIIEGTDFTQTIQDMDTLTLFAPTDAAFSEALDALDISMSELYDATWIQDVLAYHVIAERQHSLTALEGFAPMSLTTLQGEAIQFNQGNPHLRLNGLGNMTGYELTTSQGMIHEVDTVLLPATLLIDIGSDVLFDDLEALLLELILSGDIPLELIPDFGSGDFNDVGITIFAPSETALNDLASDLGVSLEALLDDDAFVDILFYHIVLESYLASELFEQAPFSISTLQGESISIEIVNDVLNINGATITRSESLMTFGTVHIIDQVLIPPSMEGQWPDQMD